MSKENGSQADSLIDPFIGQALVIQAQLQEALMMDKKLEAAALKRKAQENVPLPPQGIIINNGQIK